MHPSGAGPSGARGSSSFRMLRSRGEQSAVLEMMTEFGDDVRWKLRVDINRGEDLAPKDFSGTSDPYVNVFICGRKIFTTKIVYKTLNPIWGEGFSFPIYDDVLTSNDLIRFDCWDWDRLSSDDRMGTCSVRIVDLVTEGREDEQFELESNQVPAVSLPHTFKLLLVPQQKEKVSGWIHVTLHLFPIRPDLTIDFGSPVSVAELQDLHGLDPTSQLSLSGVGVDSASLALYRSPRTLGHGGDIIDHVPGFLLKTFDYMASNGAFLSEGIFRKGGAHDIVKDGVSDLFGRRPFYLNEYHSAHALASILKQLLRDLDEPVFTFAAYGPFMNCMKVDDLEGRIESIRSLCLRLPKPHYLIMSILFRYLTEVIELEDENLMGAQNIAIVLAPNLLRTKDALQSLQGIGVATNLVRLMIENSHRIFLPIKTTPMRGMGELPHVDGVDEIPESNPSLPPSSLPSASLPPPPPPPPPEDELDGEDDITPPPPPSSPPPPRPPLGPPRDRHGSVPPALPPRHRRQGHLHHHGHHDRSQLRLRPRRRGWRGRGGRGRGGGPRHGKPPVETRLVKKKLQVRDLRQQVETLRGAMVTVRPAQVDVMNRGEAEGLRELLENALALVNERIGTLDQMDSGASAAAEMGD